MIRETTIVTLHETGSAQALEAEIETTIDENFPEKSCSSLFIPCPEGFGVKMEDDGLRIADVNALDELVALLELALPALQTAGYRVDAARVSKATEASA